MCNQKFFFVIQEYNIAAKETQYQKRAANIGASKLPKPDYASLFVILVTFFFTVMPTFILAATTIVLTPTGTICCTGRGHVGDKSPEFVPTLAEQRVTQTKWLKGTLTLCSDRFRERSDVTGEPCGSLCSRQGTAKFEFKSPSVHSVVRGHPTAKSEFRQAEIRQFYPFINPGRSVKPEVEVVGSSGKVFALQWLTMSRILVLGTAGLMTTWEMQSKDKSTNYTPVYNFQGAACRVSTHYLPVSMHRWLCAVYVSPIVTKAVPQHLVCGDRAGSLHLYTLNEPKPQHSLHGVHGKNGVTAVLCWHGGLVYSSGRDGYVRSLRVSEGRLLSLTATRVSGSSWVSRLIAVKGKLLAICFYGVKLKLWSVGEEQTLLEVECGGAHRSWDLRLCGKRGWLVCTFLKDGTPYTFSTPLNNKMLPHIREF
ncbi:WD repeat-containing protein 6 [Portunus trituberculatus]|uniref:WD repeat-containing protein 6 n=1 Tax=Portunus trituberculatus TaxID=210409 RepID=A0A5B7D7E0_PORTR|nr:WD repeat-containing protein 6 [Portunus trituberculatus]